MLVAAAEAASLRVRRGQCCLTYSLGGPSPPFHPTSYYFAIGLNIVQYCACYLYFKGAINPLWPLPSGWDWPGLKKQIFKEGKLDFKSQVRLLKQGETSKLIMTLRWGVWNSPQPGFWLVKGNYVWNTTSRGRGTTHIVTLLIDWQENTQISDITFNVALLSIEGIECHHWINSSFWFFIRVYQLNGLSQWIASGCILMTIYIAFGQIKTGPMYTAFPTAYWKG